MLTEPQLAQLETCLGDGGIALFGADTVYGVACDANNAQALERIYELKGREPAKPLALLFFDRDAALATIDWLGPRTRAVAQVLLPGCVTLLLPNPGGAFPLAGGAALGLRVPAPGSSAMRRPVLQTSANLSGEPDVRVLADVKDAIRAGVDLELDGGELPGLASTVVDLTRLEEDGSWRIVREGAVAVADIDRAVRGH